MVARMGFVITEGSGERREWGVAEIDLNCVKLLKNLFKTLTEIIDGRF